MHRPLPSDLCYLVEGWVLIDNYPALKILVLTFFKRIPSSGLLGNESLDVFSIKFFPLCRLAAVREIGSSHMYQVFKSTVYEVTYA